MDWLDKALAKAKKALGFKDVGAVEEKCPLKETGLIVVVLRLDNRKPVEGAIVDIKGKTPFNKKTDKDGLAQFKPVEPGPYSVKVNLVGAPKDEFEEALADPVSVTLGECTIHIVRLVPLANLKVRVLTKKKNAQKVVQDLPLDGVKIRISGTAPKEESTAKGAPGWAQFAKIKAGAYKVAISALGGHADKYGIPPGQDVSVLPGETKEVVLELKPLGKLRVILYDKENKAISGKKWTLESPVAASGATGGDGLIEVSNFLLEHTAGVLKVQMATPPPPVPVKPPPPPPPPPKPKTAPPYPPPIYAPYFKDPAVAPGKPEGSVEWTLTLGSPDDYKDDSGLKARLHNLGFDCEPGSAPVPTTRAVKHYQRHHQKADAPSGVLADIKGHITALHDNP